MLLILHCITPSIASPRLQQNLLSDHAFVVNRIFAADASWAKFHMAVTQYIDVRPRRRAKTAPAAMLAGQRPRHRCAWRHQRVIAADHIGQSGGRHWERTCAASSRTHQLSRGCGGSRHWHIPSVPRRIQVGSAVAHKSPACFRARSDQQRIVWGPSLVVDQPFIVDLVVDRTAIGHDTLHQRFARGLAEHPANQMRRSREQAAQ